MSYDIFFCFMIGVYAISHVTTYEALSLDAGYSEDSEGLLRLKNLRKLVRICTRYLKIQPGVFESQAREQKRIEASVMSHVGDPCGG